MFASLVSFKLDVIMGSVISWKFCHLSNVCFVETAKLSLMYYII